jgi:hypothetical protein
LGRLKKGKKTLKAKTHKKLSTNATLPFAFRYAGASSGKTLRVVTKVGGFVFQPVKQNTLSSHLNLSPQISIAHGKRHSQMPTGGKRAISQADVMGGIGPNAAAKELKLENPFFPNWEWLHLVAFSISPTHVPSISKSSKTLMNKTKQVQQIRENLVLGSAAANTEMLTWETLIKNAVKKNKDLQLMLFCSASVSDEQVTVNGVTYDISLCHLIQYHFQFRNTATQSITAPFIIELNPKCHDRPSSLSFTDAQDIIDEALSKIIPLGDRMPQGIDLSHFQKL